MAKGKREIKKYWSRRDFRLDKRDKNYQKIYIQLYRLITDAEETSGYTCKYIYAKVARMHISVLNNYKLFDNKHLLLGEKEGSNQQQ